MILVIDIKDVKSQEEFETFLAKHPGKILSRRAQKLLTVQGIFYF